MGKPSLVAAQHAAPAVSQRRNKFGNRIKRHLRLIAMRRVPASRKNQRLRPSNAALNGFDMGYRAIFVVFALNDQSGARNRPEIFFNVPLAKLRIEPNIVPATKHFVGMLVVARKFFTQVTGLIHLANRDGASQAELFDENVRRLQNKTANLLRPGASVN